MNWFCVLLEAWNEETVSRLVSIKFIDNFAIVSYLSLWSWPFTMAIGYAYRLLADFFYGYSDDHFDSAVRISQSFTTSKS